MARDEEFLAWCRDEREKAQATIDRIEKDGFRYFVGIDPASMVEVTEEWLSRERDSIARLNVFLENNGDTDA
ncbi:hypothetical protein [Sphingobium xenophagum]|uniref:hypothetical protein n=1 Tax=Sphingobium xenophagum TaxID=121428 RepID=UPI001031A205|nr:hypothetical protein [Sphingobium xenophagum]